MKKHPFIAGWLFTSHVILFFIVILAWLLPWPILWAAALIVIPGIFIHWSSNKNQCWCTNLEYRLRTGKNPRKRGQGKFTAKLLKPIMKKAPNVSRLVFSLYTVYWVSWSLSFLRIFIRYGLS